ncbi:uncharacterized protein LOC108194510 isoform X2 [Daucus carota subsp. sativus]|uniref:uncharacterized protein LOC108194510 isoform X2 n=1 Tax=Daucus carota subsp. sativus TaxID=79200 RepID=UPI003082DD91
MFRSLISSDKALAAQNKFLEQRRRGSPGQMPSKGKSISSLEAMGIKIYGVDEPNMGESKSEISWENIAGYSQQKRYHIIAIHSPEVYDDIARGTRCKFETNRPRAVLFEGPPGIVFGWL